MGGAKLACDHAVWAEAHREGVGHKIRREFWADLTVISS